MFNKNSLRFLSEKKYHIHKKMEIDEIDRIEGHDGHIYRINKIDEIQEILIAERDTRTNSVQNITVELILLV